MSKCCLRALHDLELNRISPYQPWYSRSYIAFQHGLQLHVGLLKIMLFECWMWVSRRSSYEFSTILSYLKCLLIYHLTLFHTASYP